MIRKEFTELANHALDHVLDTGCENDIFLDYKIYTMDIEESLNRIGINYILSIFKKFEYDGGSALDGVDTHNEYQIHQALLFIIGIEFVAVLNDYLYNNDLPLIYEDYDPNHGKSIEFLKGLDRDELIDKMVESALNSFDNV